MKEDINEILFSSFLHDCKTIENIVSSVNMSKWVLFFMTTMVKLTDRQNLVVSDLINNEVLCNIQK